MVDDDSIHENQSPELTVEADDSVDEASLLTSNSIEDEVASTIAYSIDLPVEDAPLRSDLLRIMWTPGGIRALPDKVMSCYYVLSVAAGSFLFGLLLSRVKDSHALISQSVNDYYKSFERERQFFGDPRWVRQTGQSWRPIFNLAMLFFPGIVIVWMTHYYLKEMFQLTNKSRSLSLPVGCELILRQNPEEHKEPAAFFYSSAFPIAALTLFVTGVPAAICLIVYNGLGIDALLGYPSLHPNFFKIVLIQFYMSSLCACLSVLFFRSWFTFPLNFTSTEYDIALFADSIWQRPIKGWFTAITMLNCDANVIKWHEVNKITLEGNTDFILSTNELTSTDPFIKKIWQSCKKWLNLHESIIALSRRRSATLHVISPVAQISICLDDLSQSEKVQLHNCIRNFAPAIHLSGEIQEALVGTQVLNDPRYTEIWFDLMRREPLRIEGEIEPGKQLYNGKYKIVEKLKAGGEAVTYLAETGDGRRVVLKRFQLAVGDSITSLVQSAASFENETALLSQLENERIVKQLDFFVEGNSAYLCVEHVDGLTLRERVGKGGALSADEVAKIAVELSMVLEYLHGQTPPVVHRDFTPENIMLLPDGTIKLIDFSVAQQRKDTKTTDCAGKHAYTPPEQFRGQACPASDIYALGGVVYFLLTGKDPTPLKQIKLAGEHTVPFKNFEKILATATALDVADRYTSAEWLRTDLIALSDT